MQIVKWKVYLQGVVGGLLVVLLYLLCASVWTHVWADSWQSAELYRLKVQQLQTDKTQAEIVKWINGVLQAQQQAQRPAEVPVPAKK